MSSLNILIFFGLSLLTFLPSSFGGAFDYYLLAQQWPGSYCKRSNLKQPCKMPYPQSDFKLHGLWPSNVSDPQPANCLKRGSPGATLDISMLTSLTTQLNNEWPNLNGKNVVFWSSEWTTHGTCSPFTTQQKMYFMTALDMKKGTGNLTDILVKANIVPSTQPHDREKIVLAIHAITNKWPQLLIVRDRPQPPSLQEIRVCFDLNNVLTDCVSNYTGYNSKMVDWPI